MFMKFTLIHTHLFQQIQFQFPYNFLISHVTDSSISSSLSWNFHLWSSKSTLMLLSHLKFTSITARRTNVLYFSVEYKKHIKQQWILLGNWFSITSNDGFQWQQWFLFTTQKPHFSSSLDTKRPTIIHSSSFIIYSLSRDPPRLYTKVYSNCPENIVIYTIKYI